MPPEFEVLDLDKRFWIYQGRSKKDMVTALTKYIQESPHIDDSLLTDEDVYTLNKFMLKKIGITYYIS